MNRRYRRSNFLVLQLAGRDLVLTQAHTLRSFRVDLRLLDLLCALQDWTAADGVRAGGKVVETAQLDRLVEMGIVDVEEPADTASPAEEAGETPKHYWDPIDLMVLRRHNIGGYREEEVRQKRKAGDLPPPAFKPQPEGPSTDLPKPGPLPPPLGEVLQKRRSIRTYGDRPLELAELSSVLHHAARIAGTLNDPFLGEHAFRPYAAGGGRSELEIYVVANDVWGLNPGAHYFDARGHRVVQITKKDQEQDRINAWIQTATGGSLNRSPQAILIITAVFARIMWKYRGIGLATILKNMGSLYQTIYLAATALDLAPCGIGGGPELANAAWLGLDPLIESQVGAVLLGTKQA